MWHPSSPHAKVAEIAVRSVELRRDGHGPGHDAFVLDFELGGADHP
jgi:hypothetical protein